MNRVLVIIAVLFCGLSLPAQTVYFNHPVGITFLGQRVTQVAKLTLPAGTFNVVSKLQLQFASGATTAYQVNCWLEGTNIPNVSNPYILDQDRVFVDVSARATNVVLQTACYTTGGTLKVFCYALIPDVDTRTAYINLGATKISTLVRQ
jgi:hypothetical protein